MFQRMCHGLFGAHYIAFMYGFGECVRRIKKQPNGIPYVTAYEHIYVVGQDGWLYEGGNRAKEYRPLTWIPELVRQK